MKGILVALCFGASVAAIGSVAAAGGASAASLINPGMVPAAIQAQGEVLHVRWVCNDGRCVWRPRSHARIPGYAQGWGPPPRPNCVWVLRPGPQGQSHWQQVCR